MLAQEPPLCESMVADPDFKKIDQTHLRYNRPSIQAADYPEALLQLLLVDVLRSSVSDMADGAFDRCTAPDSTKRKRKGPWINVLRLIQTLRDEMPVVDTVQDNV